MECGYHAQDLLRTKILLQWLIIIILFIFHQELVVVYMVPVLILFSQQSCEIYKADRFGLTKDHPGSFMAEHRFESGSSMTKPNTRNTK